MQCENDLNLKFAEIVYESIREKSVRGRYLTLEQIESYFNAYKGSGELSIKGFSEEGRKIYEITLGKGPVKILMWSQMHGNESTTTRALLDLLNTLGLNSETGKLILERCTLKIIPMLNPDGAQAHTRENANNVDLNRDAQDLSQLESRLLRETYTEFKPDYCFNLHDQRSIFSAGNGPDPATLSFLAPAADKERTITKPRAVSMDLIAAIYTELKVIIGNRIGRYDDSFNLNCVGDTFQSLGTATILFEAGHYPGDYEREQSRSLIWHALLSALVHLSKEDSMENGKEIYHSIPNNEKLFFDVLVRNAGYLNSKYTAGQAVGILYKEVLQGDTLSLVPEVEKVGKLEGFYGHVEYDCTEEEDLRKLKTDIFLHSLLI